MRRARQFDLTGDDVLDYLMFAVPGALIFTRLHFVLFSPNLMEYLRNPLTIITGIRTGGVTIHGAIFGAVLGCWICAKIRKRSLANILDLGAFGLLIGQMVGRWGNFINREIFGLETTVPWRMGLTRGDATIYVHPTFLYEMLWNLLGFLLLHFLFKPKKRVYQGQIFIYYIGWYGLGRIWVEALRDPAQNLFIEGAGISVSFLIAAGSVLFAIVADILLRKRAKKENLAYTEEKEEVAEEIEEIEEQSASTEPQEEESND